jgi:hypothetical protein
MADEKRVEEATQTIAGLRVIREKLNDSLDAANAELKAALAAGEAPKEEATMATVVADLETTLATKTVADLGRERLATIAAVEAKEAFSERI